MSCTTDLVAVSVSATPTGRKWQPSTWLNKTAAVQYNKLGSFSAVDVTDNVEEGYINMGSIHSFTRDLSGQHKSDVLMSTLYAQNKASDLYGRTDQPYLWYNKYISVLTSIGWKVDPFSFSKYDSASPTYSIIQALKPILSPSCTDVQKKVQN